MSEEEITPGADDTVQDVNIPHAPHVESMPETPDAILDLAKEFAAYRAEMAALRNELRKREPAATAAVEQRETAAERAARRMQEISLHPHYCPGCGRLYDFLTDCEGTKTAPHPPIRVVSTEELHGDPANHTPAPASA